MAVTKLPETITKEVLLKRAQERFQSWVHMYATDATAQQMYEDMSCSCYSGDPNYDFDFPKIIVHKLDVIKYQYKDGGCYFMVDGIEVEVQDLRNMRVSPSIGTELYTDICVLTISYNDEDDIYMAHVIPDTWLYGSTSHEFDEGKPVHKEFIDAAREYIKERNITLEMQEVYV